MNSPLLTLSKPLSLIPTLSHPRRHPLLRCRTTTDNTNNAAANSAETPPPTPPDTANLRFRRGSRKRSRNKQQEQDDSLNEISKKEIKDWETMTFAEKAIELYVGEKGLLFWLNKFAYASIYIIIGAWILFRFVGPALNLYQLDSGPLSPTAILKG